MSEQPTCQKCGEYDFDCEQKGFCKCCQKIVDDLEIYTIKNRKDYYCGKCIFEWDHYVNEKIQERKLSENNI